MLRVSILGSTGSIGQSTLRVVREFESRFTVHSLSCRCRLDLLEEQIAEFQPSYVAISSPDSCDKEHLQTLRSSFPETAFFFGEEGVVELASMDCDICVSAIVGAAGLKPTLAAIGSCKRVALANKETLVMAGPLVLDLAAREHTEIIPVDSEHSAIHTLIDGCGADNVRSIILTASGGSLRKHPLESLSQVTVDEALAHPTWDMGSKITIDSATLFNKGLEVIEAHHLFGKAYDDIKVVIHQESLIHSLVETLDGALLAHMGPSDMVHPISGALTYPEKLENSFEKLDLWNTPSLSFGPVDSRRYPALELCYEAGRAGATVPTVMNGANEICVYAFLEGKIKFTQIYDIVSRVVAGHVPVPQPALEDILDHDSWAREKTRAYIKK